MLNSSSENRQSHPEELFQTLAGILGEENQSLQRLEDNLDEQYHVLINQKLADFLRVLKEQRYIIEQTNKKDENHLEEIRSFLPDPENSSVGKLIVSSPDFIRDELFQLKSQFDQRVERVQSKKDRNKVLIEKSLDMLQTQIQFLRDITQPGYDESGKQNSSDLPLINRQA